MISVSLSDEEAMREFGAGDIIIVARGRRYLTNDALVTRLQKESAPVATLSLDGVPSVQVFVLDETSSRSMENIGR